MNFLRKIIRTLVYRPFKSPDDLWRKRTRFGMWNEFLGFQAFASDDKGYNLPFISDPFAVWREQRNWLNAEHDTYDYPEPERQEWANRSFEFMYSLVEKRINKDDVILDVGCFAGYQMDNFAKKGFTNVWGIDLCKYAIEKGKKTRPHLNFVHGSFGDKKTDVICDLLVCFGSIHRVPYWQRIFNAIDRCANKYVLMWIQEATDDFNRDAHVNLAKKGFICIEKRVVTDTEDYTPIGEEGGDGPMIVLGDRNSGTLTQRNYRSYMLFRRIEPRGPAPRKQRQ